MPPRIPDRTVLGERPVPRPGAGVPQLRALDTSGAAGAGIARLGQEIVGAGAAIAAIEDELLKSRRAAQLSDAVGQATAGLGNLEIELKLDPEFKTSPARFKERAKLLRGELEQGIDDPLVRAVFAREFGKLAVTKHLNVLQGAVKQEGSYNRAALETHLDTYAHAAANATNVAEREVALNQARLSIEATRGGGWISEVQAADFERDLLVKVDTATALRDMAVAPAAAADKLAVDPTYLPNLDPVRRQRLIDTGYRQAEVAEARERAAAERDEREARDASMTEAERRLANGALTLDFVESVAENVGSVNYRRLREALNEKGAEVDNNAAFAEVTVATYRDPANASWVALRLHQQGKLTDATLAATFAKSRDLLRTEGPRSPYERSRAFLTSSLEPSAMTMDPVPRVRQGMAVREFDDWFLETRQAAGNKDPAPEVVRAKAEELVGRFAMLDMADLVERTGLGTRNDPERVLENLQRQAEALLARREAKTITTQEFNRRMAELNRAREAAERARGAE